MKLGEVTPITAVELAALTRASSRERVVQGAFGVHGLYLDHTPENQWALDLVREMRGKALQAAA